MEFNEITPEIERKMLGYVYSYQKREGYFDGSFNDINCPFPPPSAKKLIKLLKSKDYIFEEQINPTTRQWCLSPEGRNKIKVIMAGGVFDILHIGHVETLNAARALGDVLVVVIARDATVQKLKKRQPISPEEIRQKMVQSLKSVDIAVLGHLDSFINVVREFNPDIIALGYDQDGFAIQLNQDDEEQDLNDIKIQKLLVQVPDIKSSKLIQIIQDLGM